MSLKSPSNPSLSQETYTLEQLAECTDLPVRTIRYYIQRGLVSRPEGEKKGAYYLRSHLEQLLQIRKWVGAGMSLDRVAALLHGQAEHLSPHPATSGRPPVRRRELTVYGLAEGVELVIDPISCSLSPAEITRLISQLDVTLNQGNTAPATED